MKTFTEEMSTIDLQTIAYPVNCTHCGYQTVIEDAFPKCPNFNCPGRVYGRVMKYVETLDIKGCGEETVRQLVDRGIVKHPRDLYTVTAQQFCMLERKGMAHYQKFQEGLVARKTMDLAELLGALSISEAAIGTWQHVVKAGLNTLAKILNASAETLATAERVTVRKAEAMKAELNAQLEEVVAMMVAGHIEVRSPKTGTKVSGLTFAITGTLSKPRKHYEDRIKEAGGFLASSVTSATNFLVMADPTSGSSKAQDARKKGVKILGEKELLEMLA